MSEKVTVRTERDIMPITGDRTYKTIITDGRDRVERSAYTPGESRERANDSWLEKKLNK